MIIGHVGIAFGARALDRRDPDARAPLMALMAASFAPDMLDGVLALAGVCNPDGLYSHSLPAVAALAAGFALASLAYSRRATTALLVAALVLLHLPPDYVTGVKATWPGGPIIGLYVYRWPWLDLLVETPVIVAGWWMLRRSRFSPRWVVSGFTLAALLAVQVGFDARFLVSAPRPPRTCER